MTEHQSDTPVPILEKLGLAGAVEVTYDEWQKLPRARRHYLDPAREAVDAARAVYLRLPDPPPIAALRSVLETLVSWGDGSGDLEQGLNEMRADVRRALAEFDGASS